MLEHIIKGGTPWVIAIALVMIAAVSGSELISLILIPIAIGCLIWGCVAAYISRKNRVASQKVVNLFPTPEMPDEYSQRCAECGEVFGLGINICPRCRHPVA